MSTFIEYFKKATQYIQDGTIFTHLKNLCLYVYDLANFYCKFHIRRCWRNLIFKRHKIQNNKVYVMTYDNTYSCNPKYIIDELLKRSPDVDVVWAISPEKNPVEAFPERVRLVQRGSSEARREMATAKVWIDNALNLPFIAMDKREGQVYINTWHGSMGIKRLSGNARWMFHAKRCNRCTDYCITNSTFEENVFRDTFWKDVPFLQYGHPRNDVFFNPEQYARLRNRAIAYFGLNGDEKLFLYAPTFRDDQNDQYEHVDYLPLKQALEAKFGGNWVILVRPHWKDRARIDAIVESPWLKNAGNYSDMQELLPAIDAGMTDYSSWAYDYILTRRPLFLYAPDVAEYDQTRGFYFTLESTNFPLTHNNSELLNAIYNFDDNLFQQSVTAFLSEKGCYENGHASQQVVDKLFEVLDISSYPTIESK